MFKNLYNHYSTSWWLNGPTVGNGMWTNLWQFISGSTNFIIHFFHWLKRKAQIMHHKLNFMSESYDSIAVDDVLRLNKQWIQM